MYIKILERLIRLYEPISKMRIPSYVLPLILGSVWKGVNNLLEYHQYAQIPRFARNLMGVSAELGTLYPIYKAYEFTAKWGIEAHTIELTTISLLFRAALSIGGRKAKEESVKRLEEMLLGDVFK